MVGIIKLKELGYDVDFLPPRRDYVHDHIIHHMLKGYSKFNEDYIHLLSDHADSALGVEDKEQFRRDLLERAKNNQKDDVLHCALSVMSIQHRKENHVNKGFGKSFNEAHRIVVSFLEKSPEKIAELHSRFPAVTREVLKSVAPEEYHERLSA